MNIQEIDKWLDNEYGCSYTRLEELHDYFFEKYTAQKEEIERLNNIINELEKWLEERLDKLDINGYDDDVFNGIEIALQKLKDKVIEQGLEIERLNNKLELINKIVEREFPPNEFITYKIKKILKGADKE